MEYEPALELEDMEEITLGREKNAGQPRGSQDQQHGDVEDCLESVNPLKVALPDPREPTMEERREHNVTHIPFRSWCKHCVRGKSLGAAHRSGTGSATRKVPTISLDYFYLGDAEDNSQPNLIMTDSLTQRVFSMCMPCKGVGHQYNVMIVEKCCRILGYPKAVLKSDTEPSIVALRTEVQKKLPHLSAENATKGESQSNAQAESMVGKIQGQARTMRSALEASYQCVFGPRHPAFAWLIGYAGTLWSRFQRGVDGRTGYERSTGKQWRQRLPQFGECIWYQPLKETGTRKKKFEGKFEDGVFLGIQENSLLKWIGTPEGVTRAWSVKLRPESEKWNLEEFNSFVGLPWHLKPNVSRDGSSIIPVMEKDVVVELHDRPEPERQVVVEKRSKGYVPRGIYIRKDEELAKYGYTGGCDGCEAAKHGLSRKQHSNACRERIVKAMEETAEGKARVERARQRETAFIVAEHEKIEATAAAKKRSADDERVMDQVLKKREIDFDLDVPIPAAGTSPDPLPVEEFPGRGDGGGKPGEGNDEEPSSSSRPMDLGSLARICKKDVDTLSVVYEVSSLEARALLGDLVEEERSLMLQCGAWDVKDVYNLEVAELYSPPRVVEAGKRRGCLSGVAFDLGTTDEDGVPWDFRLPEMREKADHVIDVLQPELLLGCPPCHAFSALQWLNHPGMDDEVVDERMKEAVGHLDFCAQQYRKQIARQKFFLHEHPKTASSWHVPSIQQLADEPGVMIVDGDMCAQKMESTDHLGTGLVLKPTRYLTNSEEIAKELGKRCSNREVDVKVWRRRDEDAKCYKGPGSGGPNWSQIFRRVTMNADTGETIEDLRWPGDCDGRAYQQGLPENSMNIETMFYYQEDGPKMHRHVPLMSGRASQAQVYPRDMVNGIIKGLRKQLARKYPLNSLDFGPVNQEPDLDMSADDDWQTYIDEVSGKPLNTAKVTEARNEELAYADKYNVWTEVPTQEAWDRTGAGPIGTRWIDINKGDESNTNYRSRFVVQEIRTGIQDALFAATPPLESIRFLLSVQRSSRKKLKVMFIDIKRAHWCAKVARLIYVRLPPERHRPGFCARLNRAMYGTRDAAACWEAEFTDFFSGCGFAPGIGSPVLFYHALRNIRTSIHGDDITSLGEEPDLLWLKQKLEERYEIKYGGMLGPDSHDVKDVMILNRLVHYSQTGTTYEADPRHVQILINELNLNEGRAVTTPGTARTKTGDEKPLVGEQVKRFRSLAMRCNYLALDRPDIAYAAKELARQMSNATEWSWEGLKRLARFLKGKPRLIWLYEDQEECNEFVMYTDSDDAGCHETRKSTSCGALMRGSHLIKFYSSTQNILALSSGESEFYAGIKAGSVLLGAVSMAADLGMTAKATLAFDASAAKAMLARKGHGKAKHIHRNYLWLQQKVQHREIHLQKTGTKVNQADAGTKYLEWPRIQELMCTMSLVYSETEHSLALHA